MEIENLSVQHISRSKQMDSNSNSDFDIGLNKQLIRTNPGTFFMRVLGNSMVRAGICPGDIVIADRSLSPVNGKIVLVSIDGEMLIRRYQKTLNSLVLIPETENLSSITVNDFTDCRICGVVTGLIRDL